MMQAPALTPEQKAAQPQYKITEGDRNRLERIAAAWQAYDGELPAPLTPMDDGVDDNVIENTVQGPVDAGGHFLFGKELKIKVDEGAPQEAQDFLEDMWGRKEKRIPLLLELYLNGAMSGQAFLRIVPEPDGSFRLLALDPATVFARTRRGDRKTVQLYCIQYIETEQVNGKYVDVYYREELARVDPDQDGDNGNPFADTDASWLIQHWSRIGDKDAWIPAGDPIAWPYPFPPIFSCQNFVNPRSFWGRPEVTRNFVGLNRAINLAMSLAQRLNRIYGTPILWARGTGGQTIAYQPGTIVGLPNPDSAIEAVNIQSDLTAALSQVDKLQSHVDEQIGVPGLATGRAESMPRGQLSGIAIEMLFMSLIKKTDTKRCLFGELIIDVSQALLVLAGYSGGIKVSLEWQSPLPNDDLASWQAAVLEKQAGVSDTTILEERGYDPDEEMARNQTEDAQKMVNFSRGRGFPPAPPQQQQPGQEQAQPMMMQGQQMNMQQGGEP